jgi:hypothetical protein
MKTRSSQPSLAVIGLALVMASPCLAAIPSDTTLPPTNQVAPTFTNGLAAPPPVTSTRTEAAASAPLLSVWARQISKLSQAGLEEGVLIAYIDSAGTFNLTAEQIIVLTRDGVSREAISAMIQHDAEIRSGQRPLFTSAVPDSGLSLPPMTKPPVPKAVQGRPTPQGGEPAGEQVTPFTGAAEYYAAMLPDDAVDEPLEAYERWPVRRPYPVKLTSTILIYRGHGRMPNTVVLETLP